LDKDNTVQDLLVNAFLASEKIDPDIRAAMKIEYDNRLNRPSISLDSHQPQIKKDFLKFVGSAEDKIIADFIEAHIHEISLKDYREYY
ncbi:hypothetical protein K4H00_23580, partial [Mycobacterium tuberculosis]|nr:hypothetical protein [Mycobacterium tuberculosis]